MKKILALSLGIVLLAAACNNPATTSTNTNQTAQSGTVEVDMTSTGFSPDAITVTSGTVVVFKNMDTTPHQPASDPHPSHTDLPGFDSRQGVAPGASYSFTFVKTGKWGYHDHLFSNHLGSVTVQ